MQQRAVAVLRAQLWTAAPGVPRRIGRHCYIENRQGDPTEFSLAMQTSPWHFYDAEQRILTIEDIAALVRPGLKDPVKSVKLIGSWTGVAPDAGGRSLAQKLSQALDGFPVNGMDGFLWVRKDGSLRTTRQAFTLRTTSGAYRLKPGADVMAALTSGWLVAAHDHFAKTKDAEGLRRAAAGWDMFALCPERALATYETAATLGDTVAAYNAAILRLERHAKGDRKAARKWLEKAAQRGDAKARERLGLVWK
ncbi:hypothetical protein [Tahibacter harae]|uniref:Sel1 repeat-containing protein n=1 Tax=Tahibacter harae TaxID=2963937 RepID=A0ABT1QYL5_9GAMM|nr:hypothetical protein [Tahibacter harae]MCQ4167385.1 hypothetical protein [Tahibacter harae]